VHGGTHVSSAPGACIRSIIDSSVAVDVKCASYGLTDLAMDVLEELEEEGVAVLDESAGSPPEGIREPHY
jgi:hypothetical protein